MTYESRICTVDRKARDILIDQMRSREEIETNVVTFDSRKDLHEALVRRWLDLLRRSDVYK